MSEVAISARVLSPMDCINQYNELVTKFIRQLEDARTELLSLKSLYYLLNKSDPTGRKQDVKRKIVEFFAYGHYFSDVEFDYHSNYNIVSVGKLQLLRQCYDLLNESFTKRETIPHPNSHYVPRPIKVGKRSTTQRNSNITISTTTAATSDNESSQLVAMSISPRHSLSQPTMSTSEDYVEEMLHQQQSHSAPPNISTFVDDGTPTVVMMEQRVFLEVVRRFSIVQRHSSTTRPTSCAQQL